MKRLNLLTLLMALTISVSVSFAGSPRMVVVEHYTSATCGPCASQNPAFHSFILANMDKYIPVSYRTYWPAPGTDIMYHQNKPMYDNRIQYYGVNSVPSVYVNGNGRHNSQGSAVSAAAAPWLGTMSPISIDIQEQRNGNTVNFSVTVNSDQAFSNVKLRVIAVEHHHYYAPGVAGTNGETDFYHVARRMFPDANG